MRAWTPLLIAFLISPAVASAACDAELSRLAGRLVGTWGEYTVTDDGERFIGTLETFLELDGCAFRQRFTTPDGNALFQSLGYIDADLGAWRETFVFDSGRVVHYRWRGEDGDIVLDPEGESGDDRRRLRITALRADAYDVLEQRSEDDGRSWRTVEVTRVRRVDAQPG